MLISRVNEIKNQARSANAGREPWLLVSDANVHVGGEVIDGCKDKQDWGGKSYWRWLMMRDLQLYRLLVTSQK